MTNKTLTKILAGFLAFAALALLLNLFVLHRETPPAGAAEEERAAQPDKLHTIAKIRVNIIGMETGYENGEPAVRLKYRIKNGSKTELERISLRTIIGDAAGKELGTTELLEALVDVSPGGTVEKRSLIEYSSEFRKFYNRLHSGEYTDFTFTCEIISAVFADGYVYREDGT